YRSEVESRAVLEAERSELAKEVLSLREEVSRLTLNEQQIRDEMRLALARAHQELEISLEQGRLAQSSTALAQEALRHSEGARDRALQEAECLKQEREILRVRAEQA